MAVLILAVCFYKFTTETTENTEFEKTRLEKSYIKINFFLCVLCELCGE
jgi:formate hydrogenlyase subunit 6/NADH:ubiquinone oxidoreductase subunit I